MLLKIGQHYPVHVLSNTNEIHWAIARERFFRYRGHTIRDFFNEIFLSCELGVEKPAPQIYQAVVERLACPPDEILSSMIAKKIVLRHNRPDCRQGLPLPAENGLSSLLLTVTIYNKSLMTPLIPFTARKYSNMVATIGFFTEFI